MTQRFTNKPFTGRLKRHYLLAHTINDRQYHDLILQAGKLSLVIIHRHTDSESAKHTESASQHSTDASPHAMYPIVYRLLNLTDHKF